MKKIELMEERDHMRERTAQDAAEQDELDEVASRMGARSA